MRNFIVILILTVASISFAQEGKNAKSDYKITESVKEHQEMGYPISVLEKLPIVKGCETLADNTSYLAKCMKDQFNFIFAHNLKGVENMAKDRRGVSIYVEFVINKDGSISAPERVKVSEQALDQFVRDRFERFRATINNDDIVQSPGQVHEKDVNTLYGVKFVKAFK